MRNRDLRPAAKANPTIQQAFERFQKYNQLKNLSQGTIEFYSSKARRLFVYLEDVEQPIDSITEETVEDYIFYMKDQQLHDIGNSEQIIRWIIGSPVPARRTAHRKRTDQA